MSNAYNRLTGLTTASAAALLVLASMAPADALAQAAGKSITVALDEEPDNIDGCNANRSATGRVVRNNVVESLAEIDPKDGSLKPRLALSWERVDELRWRFKLREGVKFHDGVPFNAANAAKAMARTLDPKSDCETRQKFFGNLKIVTEPVSEYVLDIVTEKSIPILPTYMGALMLSSPNFAHDKLYNAIGTGPYQFVDWKAGQQILLKRNDAWWGPKPEVENVRYVFRTESSVRAAMVKVGEADIAPTIAVQDANDPAMDVSYANSETSWLRIDTHLAPLNDIRVRKAMNLAIDRKGLQGTLFSKDVIPAANAVFPAVAGHNFDIDKKIWPFNPAEAKKLLAEAKKDGVPVDKEITMYGRTGIYPNAVEVMEAVMGWYKDIGLNVKLRMTEVGEWRKLHTAPFAEDRPPNLVQTMHDNNNGDPVFTFQFKYACEGANSTYCDKELDKQIYHVASLTGEERVNAYKELFRTVYEDRVVDVMLFHMVGYTRVGPKIVYKPTPSMNTELQVSQIKFK